MSRIPISFTRGIRAWLGILLASSLLHACATRNGPVESAGFLGTPGPESTPVTLSPHSSVDGPFGPRPAIPSPAGLFELTDAQVDDFLTFMKAPDGRRMEPNRRLFEYIQNYSRDFNYQDDTLTASQALATHSGNCLSLAILTTALAQAADLRIGYQLVSDSPVYEMDDQLILKGVHVRSQLFGPVAKTPGKKVIFDRTGIIIDYFPTGRERFVANLDHDPFVAMYYRNVAARALGDGDLGRAYWYAHESLKYAPDHEEAINTLAVTHRRAGDARGAEALYRYGISQAQNKLSLMKNYRVLLAAQGRDDEALEVERQLGRMEDHSPFNWLQLARSAMDDGDFDNAVRYYRRALDLAPYMHEGYVGMAQAYYRAGDYDAARRAMDDAIQRALRVGTREAYEDKLAVLKAKAGLL